MSLLSLTVIPNHSGVVSVEPTSPSGPDPDFTYQTETFAQRIITYEINLRFTAVPKTGYKFSNFSMQVGTVEFSSELYFVNILCDPNLDVIVRANFTSTGTTPYKFPWWLIVAGIVTGGVVVYAASRRKEKPKKT